MEELVQMTDEDIDVCLKIYYNAFGMSRIWNLIDKKEVDLDFDSHIEYFRKCINDNDKYAFCYKQGNEIIGFITAWKTPSINDEYSVYIDMVAIAPEKQKNGYGKKMLGDFIENATKDSYVSLVTERGSPAYKMYIDLGFTDEENVRMHRYPREMKLDEEINDLRKQIRESIEKEVSDDDKKKEMLDLLDKIERKR